MDAAVEKGVALAQLRVWVLGEPALVEPLVDYGAQVRALHSVEALYRELAVAPCDILIVDTSLLSEDVAMTVARFQRSNDPALVLWLAAATPEMSAAALWAGAQACLPASSPPDMLAATLYSIRRRLLESVPSEAVERASGEDWTLESDGWSLRASPGGVLALTQAERGILRTLVSSPDGTASRESLIAAVTAEPMSFDPHRIEVVIHRLRRRVVKATGVPLPLRAIRGAGYRLTCKM